MVVAPLVATLFPAPDTNSSLNGLFSASATLAMLTHRVTTKKWSDDCCYCLFFSR
jgi:hypothetical protein